MFIEINNVQYNVYNIVGYRKLDRKLENGDGTYTDAYFIVYVLINGGTVEERFNTDTERDERYEEIKQRFE